MLESSPGLDKPMLHGSISRLRDLAPREAWEDLERRSLAAGAAGFLIGGCLQAVNAIPCVCSESLLPATGVVAAILASLSYGVFYYHRRRFLRNLATAAALLIPCLVDFLWVNFTSWSLFYPAAVMLSFGTGSLVVYHKKSSGSRWDEDPEEEAIRALIETFDLQVTWFDQFVVFWSFGVALLLIIYFFR